MSTSIGIPENISDEYIKIASQAKLSTKQKEAICTSGHTWKALLVATEKAIRKSRGLKNEERKNLLEQCTTLAQALKDENTPIDDLTIHKILPEEVSKPTTQKAKKSAAATLHPPEEAPSRLDSILIGKPLRALIAKRSTKKGLPPAPSNLGLSKEAISTLQKSVMLMLQYTCQHFVQYQNRQEEPPRFIQPFFKKQEGKWVLNQTGEDLKASLLTCEKGSYIPDTNHLTGLAALILTNTYSVLGNFKKASEEGFTLTPELEKMLQNAISPKEGETKPSLELVSEKLKEYFVGKILPQGSIDIFPLLNYFVYEQIKQKVGEGLLKALRKIDESVNPSQQPAEEKAEKTEEQPSTAEQKPDESLADLMSTTIFPQEDALELNSFIGNIPGVTSLLPGFSSLQQAQKDKSLPFKISMTPLASVIGELATTTIIGAFPKDTYTRTIQTTKTSLAGKGIANPEVVGQTFAKLLEKMELALDKYEGSKDAPPTLFLKLFSQDPEGKYHKSALGGILLPILKNEEAKKAITSYGEALSLYLIDTLSSKIARGDLTIPRELLTPVPGKSMEERAETVTNFLLKTLDLSKIPLPPLLIPLQPFLQQLASEPLKKQISLLLSQIDTLVAQSEAKPAVAAPTSGKAGNAPAPTPLTAIAELELLHDIPELPQFGGTLAGVLLKTLLPSELPKSTELNKALSDTSATILTYFKDSLTGTYSAENPPPEFMKAFFDEHYQLTPIGQFIKAALSVEGTSGAITAFLSVSLSKMLAHFKEKALTGGIQIPAELLDPHAPDRAEKITAYVLKLTLDADSFPLPPIIEELRTPLFQLFSSVSPALTSALLPKLDGALNKIKNGAMLVEPETVITYIKNSLAATYSAGNPPPKPLRAFFDDTYQLNQVGQSIKADLEGEGKITPFLISSLTKLLDDIKEKALKKELQIPSKLLEVETPDRAKQICEYVLGLISEKQFQIHGDLHTFFSVARDEQISALRQKFDALQAKMLKAALPVELRAKIAETFLLAVSDIGDAVIKGVFIGKPDVTDAKIAKTKEKLQELGFSQASLNFPRALLDKMLYLARDALENPQPSPPLAPIDLLFSKNPTTNRYEPTSEGQIFLALLKSGHAQEDLTTYLEFASLSLLQMICEKVSNPEFQLPAELLVHGDEKARSEKIVDFLLKTFPIQDLPLPAILEPLKGTLSTLVRSPLMQQVERVLPQLDATVKTLPESFKPAEGPAAAQAPSIQDILTTLPGAGEFGGALAGVLLKGVFIGKPDVTDAKIAKTKEKLQELGFSQASLNFPRALLDKMLYLARDALENPQPSPPLAPIDLLFSKNPTTNRYEPTSEGQILLALLKSGHAQEDLTTYLEFASLSLLQTICEKVSNPEFQLPAELLVHGDEKARSEKIVDFLLKTFPIQDLPLPAILEPLKGTLSTLVRSPLMQQVERVLPRLDAAVKALPESFKPAEGPAAAQAPSIQDILTTLPGAGEFGGALAGVLLKGILPTKYASTQLNIALIGASKAFTEYLKEALKGEYSAGHKPPEPLRAFFDDQFKLTPVGQFIKAALSVEGTDKAIGRFLATTLSSFLIHLEDKANLQIPEELLNLKAPDRAQKISKYLLDLMFDKQDFPLPSIMKQLRGPLYEVFSKIVEKQISVQLPKLDALLMEPVEPTADEASAHLAKFDGLLKETLPIKPITVITYLKSALTATYSAKKPPPEPLRKLFFDERFKLTKAGQFIKSDLEGEGKITPFLTYSLSKLLEHFKEKEAHAELQIPPELLNPQTPDRAPQINAYVLGLILDKKTPLPPTLEELRTPLVQLFTSTSPDELSALLPKFDAMLKLDPATANLLEELEKYLPDIGSALGQAVIVKAMREKQTTLEDDINTKKKELLTRQFSPDAVNYPGKLLSDLMTFLHDKLEDPGTTPPPMLEGLFSKIDGKYVRTPIGETLFRLLEKQDNRKFIVTLLEANILSILTSICSKGLDSEALLNSLAEGLGSLGKLLSAEPKKSDAGVDVPSLTDLAPLLQPYLKDLLPSLHILTLPFLPPNAMTKAEVAPQLDNLLMNLLGKGIQAALQKIEDNIPAIMSYIANPPSNPETTRISPKLWDQITGLRQPRKYSKKNLSTLSNNAFLAIQSLFPDVRIPKFLIKAIVKMSIRYIEIPPEKLLNAILTTASENNFSIEDFLTRQTTATKKPPKKPLEELTARQFIRAAIRAQKETLKEKLEEAKRKKEGPETEIKQAKNTFWYRTKLKIMIFAYGFWGFILPYIIARRTNRTIIQRINMLISKLQQEKKRASND